MCGYQVILEILIIVVEEYFHVAILVSFRRTGRRVSREINRRALRYLRARR